MKAHFREVGWVVIAQAAAFVGSLVTIKTAAVLLGPTEYGKLATALAVIGIVQICLYGAISQTATRFLFFAAGRKLLREYKLALVKMMVGGTALVLVLATVLYSLGLRDWLPLPLLVVCTCAIAGGIQMIAIAICNAARRRELVGKLQAADAILRPLLLFIVVQIFGANATAALWAYVATAFAILAVTSAIFYFSGALTEQVTGIEPSDRQRASYDSLSQSMLSFAFPFVVFGLLGTIGSHGERILLAQWANWSEVGAYALMGQLVMAPSVLYTSVINQFYYPLVFQTDPSGTKKMHSFRLYLLCSVFGVLGITVIAATAGRFIIPIFSSRDFLGLEHLLWFLGMSAGFFCIGQQLVLPGMRLNRLNIYLPAKIIHSASLLILSLILLPTWGATGMAVASLLASMLYLSAIVLANVWLEHQLKLRAELV